MTVAHDRSGDYISIQKAIDACNAFPVVQISGARTGNTIFKNAGLTNPDKQLVIKKEVAKNVVKVVE